MSRVKPFAMFFNTQGIDEWQGVMSASPGSASVIENMHVDALGQWSVHDQGYAVFGSQMESGLGVIDSLGWYVDTSGTDYLLAAVHGKIKNIDLVTGMDGDISTAFTAGQAVDFETFKGSLYAASEGLAVQKWTGSGSMSAASGWPVVNGGETYDKPKFIEKYANRLVFANFNGATAYPSHLLMSDNLAPETFTLGVSDTDGAVIQVAPGDGQAIVGMTTTLIPSSNDQVLIIFKERSIYALTGNTPETLSLDLVNPNTGALNNRSIVQVGADILYMDRNDIYSLSAANSSGTIQPKAIGSEKVKETLARLNLSQREKAWAVHLPHRREIWWAIPTGANVYPETILVYHYAESREGAAWSIRTGVSETCGVLLQKTFYTGNSTGYLHQWFEGSVYGDTGMPWLYQYPYLNFGNPFGNKRVVECFAWFLMHGTETISFKSQWRGGGNNQQKTVSKTITVSNSSSSIYGSSAPPAAVYGSSYYGTGTALRKVKLPIPGNGEQIQFTLQGTADGHGFVFLGLSGLVEVMGYSRSYK